MGTNMSREQLLLTATIAAGAPGAGLSGVIDMRAFGGGILKNNGTDIDACDICFAVCGTSDGTFTLLYDEGGTAVKIATITASTAFARKLPDELFGAFFVKLQMVTAGGVTPMNATALQSFVIMTKW
jgi:hypothetical protein